MGKLMKKKNGKNKPKHQPVQNNIVKTRKDIRKEKRNLKKIHRVEYHNKNKKANIGKYVKLPQNYNVEDDDSVSESDSEKKPIKKNKKVSLIKNDKVAQEIIQDRKREEKLKQSMKEHRNAQLLKANEEEDKIIKKLEKQLKLKKMKPGNISKNFETDGLNYLLEVCEESTMGAAITAEKHLADNDIESDFEEDLAIATGKAKILKKKESPNKKGKKNIEKGDDSSELSDESDMCGSSIDDQISDDNDMMGEEDEESDDFDKSDMGASSSKFNNKHYSDSDDSDGVDEDGENDDDDGEDFDMKYNDDISEEELKMIYTGVSDFPDGIFRPGELTPIYEETESDLDPSKMQLESPPNVNKMKSILTNNYMSELCEMDENSSVEDMSKSSFQYESDESDESDELDESESSNNSDVCGSLSDDLECENKQIIVNGKIINTYGREIVSVEEDFERCPELDKILENLSDSDTSHKNNDSKTAINNYKNKLDKSPDKSNKSTSKEILDKENDNVKRKRKKSDTLDNNKEKEEELPESSSMKKPRKMNTESSAKNENKNKSKLTKQQSDDDDDMSDLPYSDSDFSDAESNELDEDETNDTQEKKGFDEAWEDIYGRKRDKDGNIVTENANKYVPPHLRMKESDAETAETIQLKRQIKGFLNKVTGTNMHWTSSQLETLYNTHSRNGVNNAFCSLWMSAVVQPVTTSDRLAIEHAMLVAVLHANVGSEIGAHFLQIITNKFNALISNKKLDTKELENIILGLSHLYNFKIFHASLLYEILDKLVEDLSEKNIDCILVALRSVGGVLRKDDPTLLKTFINNTQEKAGKIKSATGSRINFLLDVLMAIKNNNLNKIPNYDPSYSDELKKAIRGIIRKGNSVVPLNIKLDDLLNADQKGRWWIVGSAWDGSEINKKSEAKDEKDKNVEAQNTYLLKLADTQRINTDLRRNIFCIVMSAEDYIDAFEKLQRLGLKNQQEREIIHVLISCCLQEKQYNPYYSVLAQKFCDYDRKFQMSIQYSVWDKLKDIDDLAMFQITNLAQFLTHLFIEKGLPLSVLKVIEFSDLTKASLRLMRQILLGILLHKNGQICQEVFQRVSLSPKLHLFRESLRLFISHFLIKNTDKKMGVLTEEQMSTLKERTSYVDRILQSDSKFKL